MEIKMNGLDHQKISQFSIQKMPPFVQFAQGVTLGPVFSLHVLCPTRFYSLH